MPNQPFGWSEVVRVAAACFALIVSTAADVCGDEPVPPTRHEVRSPGGTIVAISDPKHGTTVARAQTGKALWSLPHCIHGFSYRTMEST